MNKKMIFLCYGISSILLVYYLVIEFSLIKVYSPIYRLFIIFLIMLFMYLGGYFLKKVNKEMYIKIYKLNLYIWFMLYIVMLLNLTLFDKYFNRNVNNSSLGEYISLNFNIIPFNTIKNYFIAMKNHNLGIDTFIYNIFGNILAFGPFSIYLPRVFKKIDKWYMLFLIISLLIIMIEVLQMVMRSGSFDIDDYILNIVGAMIVYFIFNSKKIKIVIDKYILLKEGEVK